MSKSIKILALTRAVNAMLLNTRDDMKHERFGMIAVLETALHATDNYRGFGYLDETSMKRSEFGKNVGIIRNDKGSIFVDETRRSYYINP